MAEILGPRKIAERIEGMIREAEDTIILVSPYLKIPADMIVRLRQAGERAVRITIVYGKTDLNPKEIEKLRSIKGVGVLYVPNLHAKCYYNEHEMLVTSMNLHEYSAQNNHELGILFDRQTDVVEYRAVQRELEVMFEDAQQDKDVGSDGLVTTAPFEVSKALCAHWNVYFNTNDFHVKEVSFGQSRSLVERNNWPCPGVDFNFDGRCAQLMNKLPKAQRPAFQALFNNDHGAPHYRTFLDNGNVPRLYASTNRRLDLSREGFADFSGYWTTGVEALVAEFTRAWKALGADV
jgi:hypothetical protein